MRKKYNFKSIKIRVKVFFLLSIICSSLGIHQVPSDFIRVTFYTSTHLVVCLLKINKIRQYNVRLNKKKEQKQT